MNYWVFWSLRIFRQSKQLRTSCFGNRICFRLQLRWEEATLLGSSIQFITEWECDFSFLKALVIRYTALATNVYRNPTHTGLYLIFNSDYPQNLKISLIPNLHKELLPLAKNTKTCVNIGSLRRVVQLNGCPKVSFTRLLTQRTAAIRA
jgi:hypothetical protein